MASMFVDRRKLRMSSVSRLLAGVLGVALVGIPAAQGATFVVFKLGSVASGGNAISGDEYTFWSNNGGFNEGNGVAASLSNNTLDYKDSFVDSALNWNTVTSVHVGMYLAGVEQASIDFSPSTSKLTFYDPANILGTTYTDLVASFPGGNFFSEPGDGTYNRRWFVNENYGGCGSDTGWFVVEDATSSKPCGWETSRQSAAGRGFLYSTGGVQQNWNTTNVGIADVFAVSVTTSVPEPASIGFVSAALAGLAVVLRRRRK